MMLNRLKAKKRLGNILLFRTMPLIAIKLRTDISISWQKA